MKTCVSIFVLALSFIIWGCNSKREKTAEEIAFTQDSLRMVREDSLKNIVAVRKAQLKEARDAKEAQLRAAWEEKAKSSPTYKDPSGAVVYYVVEVQPSYNGGTDAMQKYLSENLQYPEPAKSKGIEGTVFVNFVVDKKGKVRNVAATETTLAQVDSTLINEAVRVVSAMPKWIAGTNKGKPVEVGYMIPITFDLETN